MTTLRREIVQRINHILADYLSDVPMKEETSTELVNRLADSILELRAFQPKVDLRKADPAWAILAGEEITQETQDDNVLAKSARDAFERDLKFNPLPWSSNKEWEKLEAFVIAEYQKDKLIFAKYKTWQQLEGKFQAMSNRQIKANPADFIACWPDFLVHSAMYGKSAPEVRVDDNDIPISYA